MTEDDASEDGETDRFALGIAAAVGGLVVFSVLVVVFAPAASPERGTDPPPADWRFEQLNDSHLRVTHAGGPAIAADNLSVSVGQRELAASERTWNGSVGEGDGFLVEARPGQVVEVFWLGRHRVHHLMARRNRTPS